MKRLPLLLLLLLAAIPAFGTTTQITGTLVDATGNGINGTACFSLPVNAIDTSTNRALSPSPVCFSVTNGTFPTFANVTPNDVIQPANTYYQTQVNDRSGALVFRANYVIFTGAGTFNIGLAIPTLVTTSNISYTSVAFLTLSNTFTAASNAIIVSNAGTFSNLAQTLNIVSNINGCNISSLFNAQHGALGTSYDTEAVTGCVNNPNTSTAGAFAVSGYVQNSSATAGGVPVYGQSTCIVASSACWGANFLNADVASVAVNLNGIESDVNVNNVGTFGQAYDCNGAWTVIATLVDCFDVVKPSGAAATKFWRNGINFFVGATNAPSPTQAGILFQPSASGVGQASQGFTMISNDPAAGTHAAVVNEDANGNLTFAVNAKNAQITVNGMLLLPPVAFANLGTPSNGNFAFCNDCTIANPCAGSGTGAFAKRLNSIWVCN